MFVEQEGCTSDKHLFLMFWMGTTGPLADVISGIPPSLPTKFPACYLLGLQNITENPIGDVAINISKIVTR